MDAQRDGNLFNRHSLVVAQYECGAFHLTQFRQRRLQCPVDLVAQGQSFRRRGCGRYPVHWILVLIGVGIRGTGILPPSPVAKVIQRTIRANPVEPGAERRPPIELIPLPPSLQESLLHQVFGFCFAPADPVSQSEQWPGVTFHQRLELRVAADGLGPVHPAVRLDFGTDQRLVKKEKAG